MQFVGILGNFTQERDAVAGKDGNRATIFPSKGVVQKNRVAEQFRLRMMDYDTHFREHLEALHREGRYRVFADSEAPLRGLPRRRSFHRQVAPAT